MKLQENIYKLQLCLIFCLNWPVVWSPNRLLFHCNTGAGRAWGKFEVDGARGACSSEQCLQVCIWQISKVIYHTVEIFCFKKPWLTWGVIVPTISLSLRAMNAHRRSAWTVVSNSSDLFKFDWWPIMFISCIGQKGFQRGLQYNGKWNYWNLRLPRSTIWTLDVIIEECDALQISSTSWYKCAHSYLHLANIMKSIIPDWPLLKL